MNISQPVSPVASAATVVPNSTPAPSEPALDPVTFLAALGDPVRWRAVSMMAGGQEVTVKEVAAAAGRKYGVTHKHLSLLWAAGAVSCRAGAGGREGLYYIPAERRPEPGVVDYGFCRLQFPVAAEVAGKG